MRKTGKSKQDGLGVSAQNNKEVENKSLTKKQVVEQALFEAKLLPCPFCGSKAREYGNAKVVGAKIKHYQVVVCTNDDCGCRTGLCETVEEAIYKWNTRKPIEGVVKKLMTAFPINPYPNEFTNGRSLGITKAIEIVENELN